MTRLDALESVAEAAIAYSHWDSLNSSVDPEHDALLSALDQLALFSPRRGDIRAIDFDLLRTWSRDNSWTIDAGRGEDVVECSALLAFVERLSGKPESVISSPETTPAGVLDEAALREALRVAVGLAEQNRDAILAQPYDSRYRDGYRSGIDAAAAIISGSVARALAAGLGRSGSGGGRG